MKLNDNIELLNGDCLELMKDIPDKSIDMILCDLPYGTTACKWDTVIPMNDYIEVEIKNKITRFTKDEYYLYAFNNSFSKKETDMLWKNKHKSGLWKQYNRIIKDNGAIVLFGSQPFSTLLVSSNINNFKEELIWLKNKSGSGLQAKQKNIKIHENIYVFSNSSKYTFNPQKWLVAEKEFLTQRKTFDEVEVGNNIYTPMKRARKPDDGSRNPISIVSCAVPFTPSKSKTYSKEVDLRLHPTQKPVKLLEWIINTYSNENELILDNCMGSGSTGVACVNTNRRFIGIEKDDKYYNISKERIENSLK